MAVPVALSEKHRSTLYQGLVDLIPDEQAVEEMLSYFPARDVEEPVTKDYLRAEMADFILRQKAFPTDLQSRMAERLYLEQIGKGDIFSPSLMEGFHE